MKKLFWKGSIFASMLFWVFSGVTVYGSAPIPQPKGFINDFANVISAEYKQKLEISIGELPLKTGAIVVIVTMPDIDGAEYNDYANRLYNAWELDGKNKYKSGRSILIFMTIKERKMRIVTGYGMRGILSDGLVNEILNRDMIPYFKENNFGEGLFKGTMAICQIINTDAGVALLKVKWTQPSCAGYERGPDEAQIRGEANPSVDLADDQTARQLLQEGRQIYLRSCPPLRKLKAVLVILFTPTYGEGIWKGSTTAVSAYVTENELSKYYNPMADEARRSRSIKSFIQRFKVEVWLDSNEMKSRLTSNPFQWKGKVVGFEAEFGGMRSKDSGIFDLGPNLVLVVVKRLPFTRFTRSGERFLLAGRVQGTSQMQLPFLGNVSVPELSFIGAAEPASLPMPR